MPPTLIAIPLANQIFSQLLASSGICVEAKWPETTFSAAAALKNEKQDLFGEATIVNHREKQDETFF